MANLYYDLRDDVEFPGRWFLRGPVDSLGQKIDERVFTEGTPVGRVVPLWTGDTTIAVPPFRIVPRECGVPLDFTFADFDMPVLKAELAEALTALAPDAIQRIPVDVESANGKYEIVNIIGKVKCLDEERCVYKWWTDADNRPEMVGRYRGVGPIVIKPELAAGRNIFRIAGWEIAVVVSQRIKDLFESLEVTGVKFKSAVKP